MAVELRNTAKNAFAKYV